MHAGYFISYCELELNYASKLSDSKLRGNQSNPIELYLDPKQNVLVPYKPV